MLASVPVFDAARWRSLDEAADDASRVVRGAGFDRAVFGVLNDEHTAIRGRLASGGVVANSLRGFDFQWTAWMGPFAPPRNTRAG